LCGYKKEDQTNATEVVALDKINASAIQLLHTTPPLKKKHVIAENARKRAQHRQRNSRIVQKTAEQNKMQKEITKQRKPKKKSSEKKGGRQDNSANITGDNNTSTNNCDTQNDGDKSNVNNKDMVNKSYNNTKKNTNVQNRDYLAMISYNVKSAGPIALDLREELLKHGIKVFMCQFEIPEGSNFRETINSTSLTCDFYICVVNDGWINSAECQIETNNALNASLHGNPNCMILPILLRYDLTKENDLVKTFKSNYQCYCVDAEDKLYFTIQRIAVRIVKEKIKREKESEKKV